MQKNHERKQNKENNKITTPAVKVSSIDLETKGINVLCKETENKNTEKTQKSTVPPVPKLRKSKAKTENDSSEQQEAEKVRIRKKKASPDPKVSFSISIWLFSLPFIAGIYPKIIVILVYRYTPIWSGFHSRHIVLWIRNFFIMCVAIIVVLTSTGLLGRYI